MDTLDVTGAATAVQGDSSVKTGEAVDQNGDQEDAIFFSDIDSKKDKEKEKKRSEVPAKTEEALKNGGKEESKTEAKKEAKKEEPKKDGKEETKQRVEAKKLKAKLHDKELDIEEDAVVSVKIDGKDVDVPIKELLSNYSGKTAWDKRFSELDKERKSYKTMKEQSEAKIKGIFDEQDAEMRFYKMAEFAGVEPVAVRKKFLEENLKLLEKWYSMSDDEKKADDLAFENKYLRHQQENLKKESEMQQTKTVLQQKIESLMGTHKIEKSDFVDRYDYIESLVQEGKLAPEKLTSEFVAETILKDRIWGAVDNAIKDLKVEGVSPEKIMDLVELSHQNGITPDQMKDMVDELWGQKKIKSVVDDKEKQRSEFYEGKKDAPVKQQKTGIDVWNFDQI